MDERVGKQALVRCIEILGGQAATGAVVGVKQQTISACLRNGKAIPAEWCIPLEKATQAKGEKISRHQLRPDLYPVEDSCACTDEAHPGDDPHDHVPDHKDIGGAAA